jgi:hypothetical protein
MTSWALPRLTVDDVVEARLRAPLVGDALVEEQRVLDTPARTRQYSGAASAGSGGSRP